MKDEDYDDRRNKVLAMLNHPGWEFIEIYIDKAIEDAGSLRSVGIEGATDQEILRRLFIRKAKSEVLIALKNFIRQITQENKKCQK